MAVVCGGCCRIKACDTGHADNARAMLYTAPAKCPTGEVPQVSKLRVQPDFEKLFKSNFGVEVLRIGMRRSLAPP